MPTIRVMRTFLAVAQSGSFVAAGARVGLTPAAVGLQIRALEEDLGQTLFDRSARAAVLNTAGRAASVAIESLVNRYDALCGGKDEMSGTVAVGALVSALMGAFSGALLTLKREFPALEVKLFAGLSSDFALRVQQGELDTAITTRPPRGLSASLRWSPLYAEDMVLIVPHSPQFPLANDALEILRTAPFLRFDSSTWTGDLVQEVLRRLNVRVNEGLEVNSVETIVALVRQGYGVSIVPKLDNVEWTRDSGLQVISVPGHNVVRQVGLLERRVHGRTHFTGAIKAHFAARMHAREPQ